MKRTSILGVLALFAMLIVSTLSVSADEWMTDRETVKIDAGTGDFDTGYTDSGKTTYSWIIDLPCGFSELSDMGTDYIIAVTSSNGGNDLTYSIDVNNVSVVENATIASNGTDNINYSTFEAKFGEAFNATSTHLNFVVTTNSINSRVDIALRADDANFAKAWIDANAVYLEKDKTDLLVKEKGGIWSVNDSIKISNNGLGFNLVDCNFSLKYPAGARGNHSGEYFTCDLPADKNETVYREYQKNTPYFDPDEIIKISGGATVVVYANDREDLDNVGWEFKPSLYDDAFAGLDENDDLVIKFDGKTFDDWEWDDGIIVFENKLDFKEDEKYNVSFTWTGGGTTTPITQPSAPPATEPFYMQKIEGVPVWIIIGVIAFIVVVLVVASKK